MDHSLEHITETILNIEKMASEQFNKGDVSGYLDIYHDDVTYVDPMTPGVIAGKLNVKEYFDKFYMGIKIEKAEWLNVQVVINETSNMAILTYNLQNSIRSKKDGALHQVPLWNCTEVYRFSDERWKIAHANWSFSQHPAVLSSLTTLFTELGYAG